MVPSVVDRDWIIDHFVLVLIDQIVGSLQLDVHVELNVCVELDVKWPSVAAAAF